MKMTKEFELHVELKDGTEEQCLVYAEIEFSEGTRFGYQETYVEDVTIDEIFSLDESPKRIEVKDVVNLNSLIDTIYSQVLDQSFDLGYEIDAQESDRLIDYYNELKEWN